MKNIMEYNGYYGSTFLSEEDGCLFGKILGIRDVFTYEGESVKSLQKAFHDAVDDYLNMCREHGKTPEKAYKGTFNVRISPELHQKLALTAISEDVTLNSCVESAISQYVDAHV